MTGPAARTRATGREAADALLERDFASLTGRRHALAFSYGRWALLTALVAGGAAGKRVAVPAFTCGSVVDAVLLAAAEPVFVDVDPHTLDLDLDSLERALQQPGVAAAILIHYFGWPSGSLSGALEIARGRSVELIEDSAHLLGNETCHAGGRAGYTVYSLSKNLLCPSGGMLACDDPARADRARGAARWLDAVAHSGHAGPLPEGLRLLRAAMTRYGNELLVDRLCTSGPARVMRDALAGSYRPVGLGMGAVATAIGVATCGIRRAGGRPALVTPGAALREYKSALRMPSVVARIARAQLRRLPERNRRLSAAGAAVQSRLIEPGCDRLSTLSRPGSIFTYTPVYLEQGSPDRFVAAARAGGILLRRAWPLPAGARQEELPGVAYLAEHLTTWQTNAATSPREAETIARILAAAAVTA